GGGSMANLMALAMARQALAPSHPRAGTLYASTEAHMSIPKAAALLGFGRDDVRFIPVDESFRMRPESLDRAMRDDLAAGRRAIAFSGRGGTVGTGSIDPLDAVADVEREHGAWFHVAGAYGALAAMAVPDLFRGLERASSISLDPHKWLYQPLDCGCLL